MTTRELIERLQQLPPDLPVVVDGTGGHDGEVVDVRGVEALSAYRCPGGYREGWPPEEAARNGWPLVELVLIAAYPSSPQQQGDNRGIEDGKRTASRITEETS